MKRDEVCWRRIETGPFRRFQLVHLAPDCMLRKCSGASRVNLALRGGYTALDPPCALPVECFYRCQVDQFEPALLDQFLSGFDNEVIATLREHERELKDLGIQRLGVLHRVTRGDNTH
jgi:hypothetical protein